MTLTPRPSVVVGYNLDDKQQTGEVSWLSDSFGTSHTNIYKERLIFVPAYNKKVCKGVQQTYVWLRFHPTLNNALYIWIISQ